MGILLLALYWWTKLHKQEQIQESHTNAIKEEGRLLEEAESHNVESLADPVLENPKQLSFSESLPDEDIATTPKQISLLDLLQEPRREDGENKERIQQAIEESLAKELDYETEEDFEESLDTSSKGIEAGEYVISLARAIHLKLEVIPRESTLYYEEEEEYIPIEEGIYLLSQEGNVFEYHEDEQTASLRFLHPQVLNKKGRLIEYGYNIRLKHYLREGDSYEWERSNPYRYVDKDLEYQWKPRKARYIDEEEEQ